MDPRLLAALEARDVDAVLGFCTDEDDEARVAAMLSGAVMHAANAMHDTDLVVAVGERAFAWASDDVRRALVKPIAYNVGSFTWPGWDDGTEITQRHLTAGRAAAARNLALAEVLERGLASARWLVGAHELAAGEKEAAARSFEAAVAAADDRAGELLFGGYAAIARGEPIPGLDELGTFEDGAFFVEQLRTAQRIFG